MKMKVDFRLLAVSVGAFAGVGAGGSAHAAAAPRALATETVTQVVRFADLDITTAVGATDLYGRILAAARSVCRKAQDDEALTCKTRAVERSVADVGSPLLTSIHRALTNQTQEVARR